MEIKIIGCCFDPVAGTAAGPKIINAALDCVLIYFRDGNPTSVELIELFAFTRSGIWHFKVIFPHKYYYGLFLNVLFLGKSNLLFK